MKEIKEIIGMALVILGMLGFAVLLALGAYTAFGWVGVTVVVCLASIFVGMKLLKDGR